MPRFVVLLCLTFPLWADGRVDEIANHMRDSIKRLDERIAKDPTPSIRDVTNAALARIALDNDSKGAEELLRFVMSNQNMDRNSPQYGEVPWQVGHPEIKDANAIEFASQPIGPLMILEPEFKDEATPHIRAAIAAVRRHNVKVSYTNIFLMKTVNLILMGEVIQDQAAAAEGYNMLQQWIDYTNQAGIHEFLSPTYYSVDLNSLQMGYLFAARPGARERFRAILDYLWTDIAANYFPGRKDLAGPHSRDYDFLTGGGGLLLAMDMEGLRPKYEGQWDFEKVYMLVNAVNNGYQPPASILKLAGLPERSVTGRYDTGPNRDRYNYLTKDFAIGSATGDYNAQDKMINIELASSKEGFPSITVVPDVFDEPYGQARRKDRSGHSKPFHLPLHPTTVQEKGALLALLDLDLSKQPEPVLSTSVIIPAEADEIRYTPEVTGIREGNAAVAIRILSGTAELKSDPVGLQNKAKRLVIYHKERKAHVSVGFLIVATKCQNKADFDALIDKVKSAKTTFEATCATAEIGGTKLAITDGARTVNGKPVETAPLVVNGKAISIPSSR